MPEPMPAPIPDACRARNRRASLRGLEATPPLVFLPEWPEDRKLARTVGTLPTTPAGALQAINAGLPHGATPLDEDGVYIHYAEAGNSSFVPSRFLFLDTSTLQHAARDAAQGVSFMNSHRTGGMSTPSELPFGRTFAGRYEVAENGVERVLVGFYMLRGIQPNGAGGPSTDDLHAMIQGGQLFDVSMGLYGGKRRCDVCGLMSEGGDDEENCPHVPGTTRRMSKQELADQRTRGVPGGEASYSVCDAHLGELSGVFDGAVPGAGFRFAAAGEAAAALVAPLFSGAAPGGGLRKALRFWRLGQLEPEALTQARHAYATLLSRGDFAAEAPLEALAELASEDEPPNEDPAAPVEPQEAAPASLSLGVQARRLEAGLKDFTARLEARRAARGREGRDLSAADQEAAARVRRLTVGLDPFATASPPDRLPGQAARAAAIQRLARFRLAPAAPEPGSDT